ncbi:MAG: hypothetical protein ACHP6I_01060 [Rickettsiales bacterium]
MRNSFIRVLAGIKNQEEMEALLTGELNYAKDFLSQTKNLPMKQSFTISILKVILRRIKKSSGKITLKIGSYLKRTSSLRTATQSFTAVSGAFQSFYLSF